jgi:hypothetical protein
MAVAYELRFQGATTDQYDQVLQKMGLTPGGPVPPGAIFHWAAKTGDGLLVVDVWESEEAFDKFSSEQIVPYTQEVGIGAPEVTKHAVHNYLGGR